MAALHHRRFVGPPYSDISFPAARGDQGFLGCVRRQFEHLEDHVPTLREVARALGLSERTLRRRLRALGTSYSEILQKVRRESAEMALIHSSLSVEQIAAML